MKKIFGILAPIPTFINDKYQIDYDANIEACKKLLESDIAGLYILGTTGEFAYFSIEERKSYIEKLLARLEQSSNNGNSNNKPIVICIHHWSIKKAVELAEHAIKNGAQYLSAVLPYYYPLSENGIVSYYKAIRHKINEYDPAINLFIYHIPLLPSTANISAELIIKLAEEGIINGIKDSVFELNHAKQILEGVDESFNFLCGTEPLLLYAFREGNLIKRFDGGVFSGADALPNTYTRLFNAAKNLDSTTFYRIWPFVDEFIALWDEGIFILPHIIKYAMKYQGFNVIDLPCPPLDEISPKKKKQIEKLLIKIMECFGTNKI
ncbi:MAG: dihydrodipicolinate synthase family protein [Promethearchaeota archaeon]